MGGLGPSTHRAGKHECPGVSVHRWPPKVPLQEGQGAAHARVTGKAQCVAPHQDLRANRTGDKETVRRAVARIWFGDLGLPDEGLYLPGVSSNLEAGRREDSVRGGRCVHGVKLTGEGVRFDVTGSGTVGEGEIKPPKKQGPPGLAGIQAFSCLDVRQILVVGPNHERLFCPLKPVPPFLQRQFHSSSRLPTS